MSHEHLFRCLSRMAKFHASVADYHDQFCTEDGDDGKAAKMLHADTLNSFHKAMSAFHGDLAKDLIAHAEELGRRGGSPDLYVGELDGPGKAAEGEMFKRFVAD
jgi:hypothetical protein